MSASEAWLVTFLGLGVVFFGLVLCILFIQLFGRIATKITWTGAHSAPAAPAPAPPALVEQPLEPHSEPVPPEIQAVIAATLEIEQRLYTGRNQQRLTLRRHEA